MYKSVTWLQEFVSENTLMPQLFLGVLTGGGDLFSRLGDGVQYNAVIKVSLCWMAEKWRRRLFL
ncbi:hypothetical protein NC651_035356 [Populus alba x Populus x berolinensis]|nr:hypothetical protein NC651_035356 [Populus alba x Populus x berolinensis]